MDKRVRIFTFKNTLIQIQANLFRNLFSPNIVHANYKTFTVFNVIQDFIDEFVKPIKKGIAIIIEPFNNSTGFSKLDPDN